MLNKCVLIGNLTKDPEAVTTESGIKMCRFTIAVNRMYKNANGETETDFLNIVAWRGVADNCLKYLKKGSKVAVVGQIQNRMWEKDGEKRYSTAINAEEVEFLTKQNNESERGQGTAQTAKQMELGGLKPVADDALPF